MDLSKVEAGMLRVCVEATSLERIASNMRALFSKLAAAKGLAFDVFLDDLVFELKPS